MDDMTDGSGERLNVIMEELMEESQIIDAAGTPIKPELDVPVTEAQEPVEQEGPKELPAMACGYVVGIQPGGEFVFEVLGEDPGLVQLLGLHKYAEHRLEVAKDINQGYGVPLINQQLNQLQQMLKVMLNMLTQQSKETLLK